MQSVPTTISLEFYNLGYRLTTLYCQMAILSMLIFGLLITKSGSCPSVLHRRELSEIEGKLTMSESLKAQYT